MTYATNVTGLAITSPIFLKPIRAMNKPIPAPIPTRNPNGIDAMSQ